MEIFGHNISEDEAVPIAIAIGVFIYFIFILLKIFLHNFANRDMHKNPTLTERVCPSCKNLLNRNELLCKKCEIMIEIYDQEMVCFNCGHFGKKRSYWLYSEFWVTLYLWFVFMPFGVVYFMKYYNKKICKNCGRMTRQSDFYNIPNLVMH
jgi:hypothetical protein